MKVKTILVPLILLFLVTGLSAQFNIKVGYSGSYHQLTEFNNQFKIHNENPDNGFLEDPFPKVHVLHGLEAGFRYKFGKHIGVEATWSNGQTRRVQTSGFDANEVFIEKKWRLSSNEYSIGLENYFGNLGYGASLGYRKSKISKFKSNSRKYFEVQEDKFLNLNVHLIITVETGNGTFALKPFYQAPLSDWTIDAFADNLNPGGNNTNLVENFRSFGLSFVFYNGPKSF